MLLKEPPMKPATIPYNKFLLKDPMFKEFYSENLYRAVFTFPKFTRNYSKNYKSVQYSFKKISKSKLQFNCVTLKPISVILYREENTCA